jgi:hypothetical protein
MGQFVSASARDNRSPVARPALRKVNRAAAIDQRGTWD